MKRMCNAVSLSFVTVGVTQPPTRPDPTRPITTYDSIHLQTAPGRPAPMDGRFAAIGICQRCNRPIEHGQPYMPRIPVLVGSWYGFDHQYCPPALVVAR